MHTFIHTYTKVYIHAYKHTVHTYSTPKVKEGKVEHHLLYTNVLTLIYSTYIYIQLENYRAKVILTYIHTYIHSHIHTVHTIPVFVVVFKAVDLVFGSSAERFCIFAIHLLD